MVRTFLRRASAALLLASLAAAMQGCRQKSEGAPTVVVIGSAPKLSDPAAGPLSAPDAVLVANVAQGLVRFDANGNVIGGLAERWNVSDDGLSYIFRLASGEWPDGRKITAQQVARVLKHGISGRSKNPSKDAFGAVEDIVAMTDRVIEIRLAAPRPNLLALLAQPELAVVRSGHGTGPFAIAPEKAGTGELRLVRDVDSPDEETSRHDEVLLGGAPPETAVKAFAAGRAALVLGGSFADLPYARAVRLPRNSIRFDPVSGLFGLVPASPEGIAAKPEVRRLLSQAIDRGALIAAFNVPALAARATVLEPGLDGLPAPVQPAWFGTALADRRAALGATAAGLFGDEEKPVVRVLLPDGPGADLLLARLASDWGALGLQVERAANAGKADFKLVDTVAPSTSPAWFLRSFRCGVVAVCDADADELLDAARTAAIPAQRYALLADAARRMDEAQLFIPLTAPVRWSLVADRIEGFVGNRYARHTLVDLGERPGSGD
ncbi:MAG TPA: ABC transporter substrate-binding protein [Sphingomicrobium sp.]|jgi:peptide/nickel transport system substrate-binding protein|nr:ABC transporter substrate-binding protein [Sphingomicrobium sp.]